MKPSVLVWSDINKAEIDELRCCKTKKDLQSKLCTYLNISKYETDLQEGIEMDLYYHGVVFALGNKFTDEQLSSYISILKETHKKAMETSFGNIDEAFDYFKSLVVCHSVKRPPFSAEIFDHLEATRLTDNVINTYFKHYKLYKYAFTPEIRLDLKIDYKGLPDASDMQEEITTATLDDNPQGKNEEIVKENNEDTIKDADMISLTEPSSGNTKNNEEKGEPQGMTELKNIITTTLKKEMQQIRTNVDQQMKSNEEEITKKLVAISSDDRTEVKSPKTKKGKKK